MIRAALFSFSALALSSCGFEPLYASAEGQQLGGALSEMEVGDIRGPAAPRDQMRAVLASTLPVSTADNRYRFDVDLSDQMRAVSVNIDSNARRFNYTLRGRVTYTDQETGERRTQNLQSIVSFAIVPSQYATLVGREDAVRRATIDLARKIEIDAALYARGKATPTSDEGLFRDSAGRDPLRRLEQEAEAQANEQEQ